MNDRHTGAMVVSTGLLTFLKDQMVRFVLATGALLFILTIGTFLFLAAVGASLFGREARSRGES